MRRIARRGIPYGRPDFALPDGAFRDPSQTAERGLLFMCFQRNIEKQFVFLQRTWIDNPRFPAIVKNTGDDPLLGQDRNEAQRWPLQWGNEAAGRKDFNFESPVTLEGGEYFFAPSKVFLDSL
jgi:deferrochelatase/peroxidase EfeB